MLDTAFQLRLSDNIGRPFLGNDCLVGRLDIDFRDSSDWMCRCQCYYPSAVDTDRHRRAGILAEFVVLAETLATVRSDRQAGIANHHRQCYYNQDTGRPDGIYCQCYSRDNDLLVCSDRSHLDRDSDRPADTCPDRDTDLCSFLYDFDDFPWKSEIGAG